MGVYFWTQPHTVLQYVIYTVVGGSAFIKRGFYVLILCASFLKVDSFKGGFIVNSILKKINILSYYPE